MAGAAAAPAAAAARDAATVDDCIQALAVVGMAAAEGVARAVMTPVTEVQPLLDGLVADGRVAAPGGTTASPTLGGPAAPSSWPRSRPPRTDRGSAALDGLLLFDGRLKAVVTDLQLRQTDEGPVLNDHADAAYDAAVVARLAVLHEEAGPWLTSLEPAWPRAARYRDRLAAALERALAGDLGSSPHHVWTATTAPGSSCTRTSSCWPAAPAPTRSTRDAPESTRARGYPARGLKVVSAETIGILGWVGKQSLRRTSMAVRVDLNISLDGFATTTDQTPDDPFGPDWARLVDAYVTTRTFRARVLGETSGEGTTGVDDQYAQAYFAEVGAEIMGAGMFGLHAVGDDPDWRAGGATSLRSTSRCSCSPTGRARRSR